MCLWEFARPAEALQHDFFIHAYPFLHKLSFIPVASCTKIWLIYHLSVAWNNFIFYWINIASIRCNQSDLLFTVNTSSSTISSSELNCSSATYLEWYCCDEHNWDLHEDAWNKLGQHFAPQRLNQSPFHHTYVANTLSDNQRLWSTVGRIRRIVKSFWVNNPVFKCHITLTGRLNNVFAAWIHIPSKPWMFHLFQFSHIRVNIRTSRQAYLCRNQFPYLTPPTVCF